jgi:hypothetical protein
MVDRELSSVELDVELEVSIAVVVGGGNALVDRLHSSVWVQLYKGSQFKDTGRNILEVITVGD